jgi:hypothetical protein
MGRRQQQHKETSEPLYTMLLLSTTAHCMCNPNACLWLRSAR